jgi:hypothetical protein
MPPIEPIRATQRPVATLRGYLNQLTPVSLVILGIGAALGLIIGLIIGWGLFPVQWTNAWPGDLSPEARAQYLAAVADAYVYYGDEQAAEIARNRLFDLNDNLAEEIAAAQRFFAENRQRNSNVYISNLGQLAQQLGVESPEIIAAAPEDAAAAPAAETDTEAAAPPNVGDSVRTWVNWLLTLLAAIVLIGGGIYIVGLLNRRRLAAAGADSLDDEPDGFEEEDDPAQRFRRPAPAPATRANPLVRAARGPHTGQRPADASGFDRVRTDDYGFEDESDVDDLFAGSAAVDALDAPPADQGFDDILEEDLMDDEAAFLAQEDAAEPDEEEETTDVEVALDDAPTASDDDLSELDALIDAEEDTPEAAVLTDEPAEASVTPAVVVTPSRRGGPEPRTIGVFTVHYQAGIPDYDQSYSIMDPEDGRYIGECGMGVNMKNGILQSSPDSVIALDVWLVDKKQERSYSSQNRVLFSEYVIDHKLDSAFTRERPNDPAPIVPQPGTTFQLKGPSLTLDCKVLEAVYSKGGQASGIFQSVQVEMTVRSRD